MRKKVIYIIVLLLWAGASSAQLRVIDNKGTLKELTAGQGIGLITATTGSTSTVTINNTFSVTATTQDAVTTATTTNGTTATILNTGAWWNANQLQGKNISINNSLANGDILKYDGTNWVNWVPTYISLTSLSGTAPITYNNGVIGITQASSTTDGYLSSTDWNTFNSKQNAITLTTSGNSGAATLTNSTLNIPDYTLAGLGGISDIAGLITAGTNISLSGAGTSASPYVINNTYSYTLPIASSSVLGGVKIGTGINVVTDGTISTNVIRTTATVTKTIAPGQSDKVTVTVTGATTGSVVQVSPAGDANNTIFIQYAWVSAANQVTIRFANLSTNTSQTINSTYQIAVFP